MPFWNTGAAGGVSFSNTALSLNSKESLIAKNKELTETIKKLEREVNGYDFVVQENLELKKLLFQKTEETLIATVVARPNITAYDTFLIDIGKNSEIKNGDKVLSDGNATLGVIEETYQYSAKARLFSTAGEISDALLGPESIPVQLRGLGGGTFTTEVPHTMDVKKGDSAVVSGTPEYIIAEVVSVESGDTESFQKIYLRGPVNIFNAKYVQVVKNAKR